MKPLFLTTPGAKSEIRFAPFASPEATEALEHALHGRRSITVTDEHVAAAHPEILRALPGETLILPPGEANKTFGTLEKILDFAVRAGCDRHSRFVALGGGVVGDLTGFAAAVFMRGIQAIQIPTTLLAMVDSSVGGKTAVDLPTGKNLAGAFLQPELVLIDSAFLRTLPAREMRCGLAEIIKYGVILDAALFERLEEGVDYDALIHRSCELKGSVVEADEREAGLRAILNYGHTFGHAVELLSDFSIGHGEGVAIGMAAAAECAALAGLFPRDDAQRQTKLLQKYGLPTSIPRAFAAADLLEAMRRDKKTRAGKLQLVLPRAIGSVEIVGDVPESTVLQALENCRE